MKDQPSGANVQRRRRLVVVLAALAVTSMAVLVVRYLTFDPSGFIGEIDDRLNPLRPRAKDKAAPTGSASGGAAAKGAASTDPAERVNEFESMMTALHQRFHTTSGLCYRYPAKDEAPPSPEKMDEVADALLAADLVGRLDALLSSSTKWTFDADNAAHAAPAEVEIVDYAADEAGPWTKLGVAMHRGKVQEAAHAAFQPKPPPVQGVPLSPEEEAKAKPLWERFSHMNLLQGANRVVSRMRVVDLKAPQLRLVEPGMTQSAVRGRLGPAEEDGEHWRYPRLGTEVSFDKQGLVIGIASRLAFGDQVLVDGAEQRSLDEPSLARLLGKPLRDAVGEQGEPVLVYPAGPHAKLLVFGAQLARVELWRKDLVVSAAR